VRPHYRRLEATPVPLRHEGGSRAPFPLRPMQPRGPAAGRRQGAPGAAQGGIAGQVSAGDGRLRTGGLTGGVATATPESFSSNSKPRDAWGFFLPIRDHPVCRSA
jgi:hypothetical protein